MTEETRKWGVVALVSITVLAILFGVLSGMRTKKLASAFKEENAKRLTLEAKVRDLSQSLDSLKEQSEKCAKSQKSLMQENKRLKGELQKAHQRISKLETELKRLNVLKETLEENLKNALMAIPEEQRKEIASQSGNGN